MANNVYESEFIVNSFYAINKNTGEQYTPDEEGYIQVNEGDIIIFRDTGDTRNISLNTQELFTKDLPLKVQINDNGLYPFYLPANSHKGIQYMRIYSITALTNSTLYYEGLAS